MNLDRGVPPELVDRQQVGKEQQHVAVVLQAAPPDVDAPRPLIPRALPHAADQAGLAQQRRLPDDPQLRFPPVRVPAPAEHQGVGGDPRNTVGLGDGDDPVLEPRDDLDLGECGETRSLEKPVDPFLLPAGLGDELFEIADQESADGQDAAALIEPSGESDEVPPPLDVAGEQQDVGAPVPRRHRQSAEVEQRIACQRHQGPVAQIAPGRRHRPAAKNDVDPQFGDDGDEARDVIDQEHHAEAGDGRHQGDGPGDPQRRTERRRSRELFEPGDQVDHAVGRQEEHRQHGGDGVEITEEDRRQGDRGRDHECSSRRPAVLSGRPSGRHTVRRQGLESPRSAEHAADGRGDDRAPQAGKHEQRHGRDPHPDQRVVDQFLGTGADRQDDGHQQVDCKTDEDRPDRPPRDVPCGVLEIARKANPGHDSGDRGKEDGEDPPEPRAVLDPF